MATLLERVSASPNFDILERAIAAAGLGSALTGADVTLLAPRDEAFAEFAGRLGYTGDTSDDVAVFDFVVASLTALSPSGDPLPILTEILTYHVIPGRNTIDALGDAGLVGTLNGLAVAFEDDDDEGVRINDRDPGTDEIDIVTRNVSTDDGVLQSIDGVLLPFGLPQTDGTDQVDIAIGTDDDDELRTGADNDVLIGKGGDDLLNGGSGADSVDGGDGNDRLYGFSGDDTLTGGLGDDRLIGGEGDDRIVGGLGRDVMVGGEGEDRFVFGEGSGRDYIKDFDINEDRIDLSSFDGIEDLDELDDLDFVERAGSTIVIVDADNKIVILGIGRDELIEDLFSFGSDDGLFS